MKYNKMTEIQMQIIINNNLYKRNLIDEKTHDKANEQLYILLRKVKL